MYLLFIWSKQQKQTNNKLFQQSFLLLNSAQIKFVSLLLLNNSYSKKKNSQRAQSERHVEGQGENEIKQAAEKTTMNTNRVGDSISSFFVVDVHKDCKGTKQIKKYGGAVCVIKVASVCWLMKPDLLSGEFVYLTFLFFFQFLHKAV